MNYVNPRTQHPIFGKIQLNLVSFFIFIFSKFLQAIYIDKKWVKLSTIGIKMAYIVIKAKAYWEDNIVLFYHCYCNSIGNSMNKT